MDGMIKHDNSRKRSGNLAAAASQQEHLPDTAHSWPLVTVIIPAYNAARFIGETLASAQAQTYPNLEIIVVDDGSADETASIVGAVAASDARITLIRQENAGVAAARNRAIAAARGEYVAPLDADDLWHPENLAAQVEALEQAGPRAALAYASSVVIDKKGVVQEYMLRTAVETQSAVRLAFIGRNFIGNGSACVMRRGCALSVGGYDTSLRARGAQGCEDLSMAIALSERWNFAAVPRFLIGYRQHDECMTRDVAQITRSYELVLKQLEAQSPELSSAVFSAGMAKWYAGRLGRALFARDLAAAGAVLQSVRRRGRHCLAPFVRHCSLHFLTLVQRYLRRAPTLRDAENGLERQITLPSDWQMIEPMRIASESALGHDLRGSDRSQSWA